MSRSLYRKVSYLVILHSSTSPSAPPSPPSHFLRSFWSTLYTRTPVMRLVMTCCTKQLESSITSSLVCIFIILPSASFTSGGLLHSSILRNRFRRRNTMKLRNLKLKEGILVCVVCDKIITLYVKIIIAHKNNYRVADVTPKLRQIQLISFTSTLYILIACNWLYNPFVAQPIHISKEPPNGYYMC